MIKDQKLIARIEKGIDDFDKQEALKERVLRNAFVQNQHIDEDTAIIRVTLLNTFYSTRLNYTESESKTIDVKTMALRIVAKPELESMLHSKNAEERIAAFRYIATGSDEDIKRYNAAWSFASKYCSFCNAADFPIMDSYARAALCDLNDKYSFYDQKITPAKLEDYNTFCTVHKRFLESLPNRPNGEQYTHKLIDKYLWYSKKYGL